MEYSSAAPIRVLVAEDDETSALVARTILERLGCVADVVTNGAEAIDHFRLNTYDLVLMDWEMPVMNGIEATVRIRTMPGGDTTPIVGTTAGRDRAECIAGGMNDVMPKPFVFEKLRPVLARWTRWTNLQEPGAALQ
jgi:CheY-like chemotaxis protein